MCRGARPQHHVRVVRWRRATCNLNDVRCPPESRYTHPVTKPITVLIFVSPFYKTSYNCLHWSFPCNHYIDWIYFAVLNIDISYTVFSFCGTWVKTNQNKAMQPGGGSSQTGTAISSGKCRLEKKKIWRWEMEQVARRDVDWREWTAEGKNVRFWAQFCAWKATLWWNFDHCLENFQSSKILLASPTPPPKKCGYVCRVG